MQKSDLQQLTERQQMVLRFIESRLASWGYPPTIREIGEHLGIRSTNGVNDHLKALEKKGFLTRQGQKSRTLVPIHHDRAEAKVTPLRIPGIVEIPIIGKVAAGLPLLA